MAKIPRELIRVPVLAALRQGWRDLGRFRPLALGSGPVKPEMVLAHTRHSLTLALLLSEVTGTYIGSPLLSLFLQYYCGSGYLGIVGSLLGDYLPAVVVFAAVWFFSARSQYVAATTWRRKAALLSSDLLPVYASGLKAALPVYLAGGLIAAGIVWAQNMLMPGLGDRVPIWFLTELLSTLTAEILFLGTMLSALQGEHAVRLAYLHLDRIGSRRRGMPVSS